MSTGYFIKSAFGAAAMAGVAGSSPAADINSNHTIEMPSSEVSTVGQKAAKATVGVVESVVGGGAKTAMTQMTGVDHKAQSTSLKTNVAQNAGVSNSAATLKSTGTLQDVKQVAKQEMGAFEADVKATQASLQEAVDLSTDDLSLDKGAVGKAIAPTGSRDEASAALGLAGGAVGSGLTALAEIRSSMQDNLSDQDQHRLAEQAQKCLTPVRDSDGNVVGPARVQSNLDVAAIEKMPPKDLLDAIKEIMRPAEDQVEGQAFNNLINDIDQQLSLNGQSQDRDEVVASADVDTSDVAADELSAQQIENLGDGAPDPIGHDGVVYNELAPACLVACGCPLTLSIDKDDLVVVRDNDTLDPVYQPRLEQQAQMGSFS